MGGSAAVGLGGGGGGTTPGFPAASGTTVGLALAVGTGAETLGLDWPGVGATPPGGFRPPVAAGAFGAAGPAGVGPAWFGVSLALGLAAFGVVAAAPGGADGAALAPGTGSALAFGNAGWPCG
ncbi:MAG: hypothetical protein ACJ8EL_03485, partial [Rhizomicrobium sp.]